MLFGALFAQSQSKRLAVEPFDLCAFLLATTVKLATVRVRPCRLTQKLTILIIRRTRCVKGRRKAYGYLHYARFTTRRVVLGWCYLGRLGALCPSSRPTGGVISADIIQPVYELHLCAIFNVRGDDNRSVRPYPRDTQPLNDSYSETSNTNFPATHSIRS